MEITAGYASSRPIDTPGPSVMELYLPFRCYCARKQVHCEVVVLQNLDLARALISYVSNYAVNTLILGTSSKKNIGRLFKSNVSSNAIKGAPDFCNVYLILRGKVSSARHATRPTPHISSSHRQLFAPLRLDDEAEAMMSSAQGINNTEYDELTVQDDCSSFSSSEEGTNGDFLVSDDEKASDFISQVKKSECDHNITNLSTDINENHGPSSQNSIAPDRRRRSVSSPLVGGMDFKNKQVEGKQKEAIYIDGSCKAAYARQQLSLQEMEDDKKSSETNNGDESGSTARGRRRRNKAKAVEACDGAHKLDQNAALSMTKTAEPGKEAGDTLAKIYRIIVCQAIFNVVIVLFFVGWQVRN